MSESFDRFVEMFLEATSSWPERRVVAIVFDPSATPDRHVLYGNAGAADLAPVLRDVLARLDSGELRMPVADGLRWE